MKKIIQLLIIAVLIPLGWSCSEDIMDRINKNVNNSTDVESKFIITDIMTSTAFNVEGGDLAFYTSSYIEQNVGIYNQLYYAEIRSGEPTSSTTFNNTWDAIYRNLYNAKVIIDKCSTGGSEEGNYHTLGIAQILTAYNLAVLTDMFGDVPWTEALQPDKIYTPILDKQQDIYTAVFDLLDNAIANLKKETLYPSLGFQDFLYNGNSQKWLKFAYGLKARYLMRLSYRNPDYADVIAYADSSFSSSSEQCQFNYNGSQTMSPFFSFFTDRDYLGSSQSLHDKLVARNDPRDTIFFKAHPKSADTTVIVFAPNGSPDQKQGFYSISALSTKTEPTYLLSYHEIQFLKAEAYARLNNLIAADSLLQSAIKASFAKLPKRVADSLVDKYYTDNVKDLFDADPVSEIMNQKYLAFYEVEAVEAYNDYRRLVAMGDNVIQLDNPLDASKFPLRLPYGADDVTTNHNVAQAYGDGSYVYSEKVWWAGGTR